MTRNTSKFIPDEEIQAAVGWEFGAVDPASVRFAAKLKAQAEQEDRSKEDALRQAGYSDGYTQGYAQGHAQATLEGQRQIAEYIATQGMEASKTFGQIFESASSQIADAEEVMARGILELSCEIARQVLRHELSVNPNALQPVVREALGMLALDCKAAVVRLHPIDLDVLAGTVQQEFPNMVLTLAPDTGVARGGCVVESGGTVVDATVPKRWMNVVGRLGLPAAWETADDAS